MPNANAGVNISVDVDGAAAAQAKLIALGKSLKNLQKQQDALTKASKNSLTAFQLTEKRLKDTAREVNRFDNAVSSLKHNIGVVGGQLKVFGSALSGLFKLIKYGAIEFAGLTAAMGAFKLAVVSGQIVVKAWQAVVRGFGMGAGVAVAAISTVIAAIRELQVAQLKPLYKGQLSADQAVSSIVGSRQLAMYGKGLNAIIQAQADAGGRVDAQFRQRLTRLGDFAGGDPKRLQQISTAFSQMQKEGKVTAQVYSQLQQSSPALAKAFEELTGGQKKAASAAASGKVSYEEFLALVMSGKSKALEPFNGALDEINNTLIGRLKGSLTVIKEDLTGLGDSFVGTFKGPLATVESQVRTFIMKISPTLRNVFPDLVAGAFGTADGVAAGLLDKLATLINVQLPRLVGAGGRLSEAWASFRETLRGVGEYLNRMSQPFSVIYDTILRPLGQELATTFNYALQQFGNMVNQNSENLRNMGDSIRGVFEGIRGLIAAFSTVKKLMQPFVEGILQIFSTIGSVLGDKGPFGQFTRFVAVIGILALVFGKVFLAMDKFRMATLKMKQELISLFNAQAEQQAAAMKANAVEEARIKNLNEEAAAAERAAKANQKLASAQSGAAAAALGGGSVLGMSLAQQGAWVDDVMANGKTSMSDAERAMRYGGLRFDGPSGSSDKQRLDQAWAFGMGGPRYDRFGNKLDEWAAHRKELQRQNDLWATRDPVGYQKYMAGAGPLGMQGPPVPGLDDPNGPMYGPNPAAKPRLSERLKKFWRGTGEEQSKGFKGGVSKYGVGVAMGLSFAGAAISGMTSKTNNTGQMLGGAVTGAGTGAMMGSMFGPWGTLIGGAAGGIIGGIGGFIGANKQRERIRKESMQAVTNRINEAGGTFNTEEDFSAAYDAALQTEQDIKKLNGGLKSKIEAAKSKRNTAKSTAMQDFARGALTEALLAEGKIKEGQRVEIAMEDIRDAENNLIASKGEVIDAVTKNQIGRLDVESDIVETAAAAQLQKMGIDADIAKKMVEGRNGGKNAWAVADTAVAGLDSQIGAMEEELKKLEAEFGNTTAASEQLHHELKVLAEKHQVFSRNQTDGMKMTGLSAEELASEFDKMGKSLSETGIGIDEFNHLLGYTGNTMADLATAAGRVKNLFAQPAQTALDKINANDAYATALTNFYELRPVKGQKPTELDDATAARTAAELATAFSDRMTMDLASGKQTLDEMFFTGKTVSVPGVAGSTVTLPPSALSTLEQVLKDARASGVPENAVAYFEKYMREGIGKVTAAKDDPFALAQVNPYFNDEFTKKVEELRGSTITAVSKGQSVDKALTASTDELTTWLKEKGLTVNTETQETLKNLIGNSVTNSSAAIKSAFDEGALIAYTRIKAAMTGGSYGGFSPGMPGLKSEDTSSPRASRFGDTASARFSRTMAAHSRFNSTLPGKRTVTSGVRNWKLGSVNSDHTTGAAFDLVGDNLLAYGKQVRDAGGFAEIHGAPSGRHLHVVPSVGDSYAPKPVAAAAPQGGTTVHSPTTINVYGAEGQSVNELADEVFARLERRERSMRERS